MRRVDRSQLRSRRVAQYDRIHQAARTRENRSPAARAPQDIDLAATVHSLVRYFKTSPEVIRLAVMMYVRFPLSLRNVEDLLHERGIDICHETVRLWWNRFGPVFAAEIRKRLLPRSYEQSN